MKYSLNLILILVATLVGTGCHLTAPSVPVVAERGQRTAFLAPAETTAVAEATPSTREQTPPREPESTPAPTPTPEPPPPPVEATPPPSEDVASAPATMHSPPSRLNRNTWAVLIGISEYEYESSQLPRLAYAAKDARDVANALLNNGWSRDHIHVLTDEQATERNIRLALESWLTKARPEDTILLYWAGHGYPDPDDPRRIYLACYDTDINFPVTGMRMDRVRNMLEERNAHNVVVIADTCHSGGLMVRSGGSERAVGRVMTESLGANRPAREASEQDPLPPGWIFMTAADTDRLAIEHSSLSNGLFTHVLLQGLAGAADGYRASGPRDGVVTFGELREWMRSRMPDEAYRVVGKGLHPEINTNTADPRIWSLPVAP